MFLASLLDPSAVSLRFTQQRSHDRELITVESLENAHAQRLLSILTNNTDITTATIANANTNGNANSNTNTLSNTNTNPNTASNTTNTNTNTNITSTTNSTSTMLANPSNLTSFNVSYPPIPLSSSSSSSSVTLAVKRWVLLQFALLTAPGLVTLVQGSEFASPDPFLDKLDSLRLHSLVGRFRDGSFPSPGPYWGFAETTRRLLALRRRYRLYEPYTCTQISQISQIVNQAIVVLQVGSSTNSLLFVLNCEPRNFTGRP